METMVQEGLGVLEEQMDPRCGRQQWRQEDGEGLEGREPPWGGRGSQGGCEDVATMTITLSSHEHGAGE